MSKGQEIKIYSFKHNGSFHRLWTNITFLDETDDYIVVGNLKAKVTESDGRFWEAREPAITVFYKKEWYNVICMIRPTGIHYYCNIASPSVVIEDDIYYIDYDLDVGMSPNGSIRILDEGEYRKHSELMGYSAKLDYALKSAMYEVEKMCHEKKFPFNDEAINEYYKQYLEILKEKKSDTDGI